VAKNVIENVVYPCTARKFFCGYLDVRAIDGGYEIACEIRHETENKSTLLFKNVSRKDHGCSSVLTYLVCVPKDS
jgi:hypothetical protein